MNRESPSPRSRELESCGTGWAGGLEAAREVSLAGLPLKSYSYKIWDTHWAAPEKGPILNLFPAHDMEL